MKSIKTLLTGAIVAGLLLMSAGGAQAAYTGLYTSSGNPNVTLGNGSFSIGSNLYGVSSDGYFWSTSGTDGYFYGASLDVAELGNPFAFLQSETPLNQSTLNSITTRLGLFGAAAMAVLQMPSWLVPDPQAAIQTLVEELFQDLNGYSLKGSTVGFGTFTANGTSFDIALGTLEKGGLDNMFAKENIQTYIKATPIPGAVWLLGSGLVGLAGLRRRMRG